MTYKQLKEEIEKLTPSLQESEILIDITGEKATLLELRVFHRTKPEVELFADWDI